jgi:cysteine-rich repeat protein
MKPGSVYEDCVSCDTLLEQKPDAVFEGCDTGITKIQTTGVIETTVVTTTPPPLEDDQCGNGKVMDGSSEECDDGNTQDGDGCTQECKIEPGWKCTSTNSSDTVMPCVKACGDGKVDKPSEECDDGNALDGDGCGRDCIITIGWACAEDIHGISRCRELPECANWKREWEKGEECDDGNFINGDGCSQFCTIEAGYACTNFSYKEDVCCATLDLCGNGKKDLCEKCDDGNRKSNDGCSSECVVEQMYQCRDGCNGPLCISESDCDEHLIGRRVQVIFNLHIMLFLCAIIYTMMTFIFLFFVRCLCFLVLYTDQKCRLSGLVGHRREGH